MEAIATTPTRPDPVSRVALAKGAPLHIDPVAPTTLPDALRRTAREFPHKGIHLPQALGGAKIFTYPELLDRALRIAAGFRIQGLEVGAKAILQLDSLEDHFAVFWACQIAGIVPVTVAIAPTYAERNGIVDKLYNTWRLLGEPVIVTAERLEPSLKNLASLLSIPQLNTLCVEELRRAEPGTKFPPVKPEDVAFIQLSSGSTGVPKCIQETHRAIIAHIHSSTAFNGYSSDDVTLNWLPMDHVVPILTFHLKDTYLGCQQIHVPASQVLAEPLLWLDLMDEHRVTHTWAPNFGFKLVSDRLTRASGKHWDLSCVKFFMNAGEQVTVPVVRDFLDAVAPFGVRESAMQPAFGMAEVCTCMTYANQFNLNFGARRFLKSSLSKELEPAAEPGADTVEFVSLGKVTPGISIRITDANNELLPEKWIGRFQIKGPVVTPGYFQNDEANRDAFVGDGWFNSGDLGFIADGELFLTGREKEMIIIRGAKFYCYEVEDVVNSIPGVEPTFVATCGTNDPRTGTETLAVFFVPAGATEAASVAQAIRRQVTARLGIAPGFVVPLAKAKFPKTTSGKIQRTQLKKLLEAGEFREVVLSLERVMSSNDPTSARTEIEKQVAAIWEEVLGQTGLQSRAHLFELGGDSLKATQIASRIRERWQVDFPPYLLFDDAGTIQGMAQWITGNLDRAGANTPPAILPAPRNGILPLSYSQLRLWLADQIEPGTSLYNIGRTFELKGALDFSALERAINAIVERHEILRTVYRMEIMPEQEILPTIAVPLPRHELAHLMAGEQERVVSNLLSLEIARPFDLAEGPLLRVKLIRLGENKHLLLLTCHQIVTDAWSLGVFARELAELYSGFLTGEISPLPPLSAQYADYAVWQQRWLANAALEKQLAFWTKQLAGWPAPPRWPNNNSRTPSSNESNVKSLALEKSLLQDLRAFNVAENVTSYMTLLTVYKLLIAGWTNSSEVVVGSPESGRRRFETEKLLGCFVNMLPLRTRILPEATFRSLLHQVRNTTAQAFANADVPFEQIQSAAGRHEATRGGLFQVWFGPIDSLQPFSMGEVRVTPQPVFPPEAQFDLSCFVSETADSIRLFFEYKKQLMTSAQLNELLQQFQWLLSKFLNEPETLIRDCLERIVPPASCYSRAAARSDPLPSDHTVQI